MKLVSATVLLLLLATSSLAADQESEKLLRALQSKQDPNLESSISSIEVSLKFNSHSEFCKFVTQILKDHEADITKNSTDKKKGQMASENLIPTLKKKIPQEEPAAECRKKIDSKNSSGGKAEVAKLSISVSKLVEYQHNVKNNQIGDEQINQSFYDFLETYLQKANSLSGTVESDWKIQTRPKVGIKATEAVGNALFEPTPGPLEKINIPKDEPGTN
ncbi:MAG: hypothetical protein AB7O96_11855 [Pseudobdellovibrionaceae bacterium]